MPHITLHFTNNIESLPNFNNLFSEVHRALNDNAGIKIENLREVLINQFNCLNEKKTSRIVFQS